MNETEINAKFEALIAQRNDAQNVVVNLAGSLAVAQERIKELDAQLTSERERISDLEKHLLNNDDQGYEEPEHA